jgi:hypothetical protein
VRAAPDRSLASLRLLHLRHGELEGARSGRAGLAEEGLRRVALAAVRVVDLEANIEVAERVRHLLAKLNLPVALQLDVLAARGELRQLQDAVLDVPGDREGAERDARERDVPHELGLPVAHGEAPEVEGHRARRLRHLEVGDRHLDRPVERPVDGH